MNRNLINAKKTVEEKDLHKDITLEAKVSGHADFKYIDACAFTEMFSRLYLFPTVINHWGEYSHHTQQQAEDGPESKWNVSSSEALDSSIHKPDLQWKI